MKVIVFGSINMDLVAATSNLPKPGETVTGRNFLTTPGGKGANQAVATSRLGIETVMVGRVGNDSFADSLLENLRANGVDINQVQKDRAANSGVALIAVDDEGENSIIVIPGANGLVGETEVSALSDLIEPGDILLLQLEVPLTAVIAAARVAARLQATIILDPAPAQTLPDELIVLADIITPNETEVGVLTGISVTDRATAKTAVHALHQRGARQILLKMGGNGALWSSGNTLDFLPPFQVDPVDSVAAGDACNGGLAAGLCSGLSLGDSLQWGMAVGALATTKRGAQEAMPDKVALLDLILTGTFGWTSI